MRTAYQVSRLARVKLISTSRTVNWWREPSTNSRTPNIDTTRATNTALRTLSIRHRNKIDRYSTTKIYINGNTNSNRGKSWGLVFIRKTKPNRYSKTNTKACFLCLVRCSEGITILYTKRNRTVNPLYKYYFVALTVLVIDWPLNPASRKVWAIFVSHFLFYTPTQRYYYTKAVMSIINIVITTLNRCKCVKNTWYCP